jgi:hypothetical protein
MAIPSFFRQNKPRGFNYKPRYYDPVKEEWEERRRAMELAAGEKGRDQRAQGAGHRAQGSGNQGAENQGAGNQGSGNQVYRSRIVRGSMRGRFARSKQRSQHQSTIRLIVILLLILLIVYFYLRF